MARLTPVYPCLPSYFKMPLYFALSLNGFLLTMSWVSFNIWKLTLKPPFSILIVKMIKYEAKTTTTKKINRKEVLLF